MKPMPMTLGGVPTGVARPPIDAANEVISISAVGKAGLRRIPVSRSESRRKARMARPMVNIIAVVAVFEIQAEIDAVTAPNANRIRRGLAATQECDRTP
jgi:hypothetical protein